MHSDTHAMKSRDRILVWDAPVRVFHWLLVLCFAGAWLTSEGDRWRQVHVTLGYTVAGLVAFRLVWGLVGTRHARFASFVRGPSAIARYIGAELHGGAVPPAGHNPAGAVAIVALLALAAAVTGLGWATLNDWGGHWMEELHEGAASLMLGVVALHVTAVLLHSWLHRDGLIRAMVTGHKRGDAADGVRSAWWTVAVLLLAAVLGFWAVQWQSGELTAGAAAASRSHHRDGDDD
jgi:cytochrome b